MDKVVKDGQVAVLVSPGYGAGWSSWNIEHAELLLFHPVLVNMVLDGNKDSITNELVCNLINKPNDRGYVYLGGLRDLTVEWVQQGTRFEIHEYDGNEHIHILGPDTGHVA